MKIIGFFLIFVSFPSFAESQDEKAAYRFCKEQGYKIGTLDFESCYNRKTGTTKTTEYLPNRRILGRDRGGEFDKSRIKDEALDLRPHQDYKPDEPSFKGLPPS